MTIGGYKSALLADLVGAYMLSNTREHFAETTFDGLYRDDGFAIFKGKWNYKSVVQWRNKFQQSVNQLLVAEADYLQNYFTCCMWLDESINHASVRDKDEKVSIEKGKNISIPRYGTPLVSR